MRFREGVFVGLRVGQYWIVEYWLYAARVVVVYLLLLLVAEFLHVGRYRFASLVWFNPHVLNGMVARVLSPIRRNLVLAGLWQLCAFNHMVGVSHERSLVLLTSVRIRLLRAVFKDIP